MNTTIKLRALWLAALIILPLLVGPVAPIAATHAGNATGTPVTGCGVIDQPGVYHLSGSPSAANADLSGPSGCIHIEAENVTLDGQGHTLTGPANDTGYGVEIENTHFDNITVRNITFRQFREGIRWHTANGTAANVTVRNTSRGIAVYGSDRVTIVGFDTANAGGIGGQRNGHVIVHDSHFGADAGAVSIDRTDRVSVHDNRFGEVGTGVGGSNATIYDNHFVGSGQGVDLLGDDNTTIRNNTFTGVWAAVTLDQVSNITIVNNTIENAGDFGFRLVYVRNSTIRDNVIENASRYGIQIRLGLNDTAILNNTVRRSGEWQFRTGPSLSDSTIRDLHLPNATFTAIGGHGFGFVSLGDLPDDPSGAENVSLYANVSAVRSDAVANLSLTYNGSRVDESNLTIWRHSNGEWINETPTATIDTVNDTIRVKLTEFSVLAPMELTGSSSSDGESETGESGGSVSGGSSGGSKSTDTPTTVEPTASPEPTRNPTATSTTKPTATATESDSRTATTSKPKTADDTAEQSATDAPTTKPTGTETPGQAGFGILVALIAVLVLLAIRRR